MASVLQIAVSLRPLPWKISLPPLSAMAASLTACLFKFGIPRADRQGDRQYGA